MGSLPFYVIYKKEGEKLRGKGSSAQGIKNQRALENLSPSCSEKKKNQRLQLLASAKLKK